MLQPSSMLQQAVPEWAYLILMQWFYHTAEGRKRDGKKMGRLYVTIVWQSRSDLGVSPLHATVCDENGHVRHQDIPDLKTNHVTTDIRKELYGSADWSLLTFICLLKTFSCRSTSDFCSSSFLTRSAMTNSRVLRTAGPTYCGLAESHTLSTTFATKLLSFQSCEDTVADLRHRGT